MVPPGNASTSGGAWVASDLDAGLNAEQIEALTLARDKERRPPTVAQYVRERLGLPAEWQWVTWQVEGEHPDYWGQTIEGGVYPPKERGKNKGKPNFAKGSLVRKMTVLDAELNTWVATWEQEEGRCRDCYGHGWEWRDWSADTGNSFKPCRRCRATGKPPLGNAPLNDGGSSPSTHEATSSNGLTPDLNEGSETNGLNPNQEQP